MNIKETFLKLTSKTYPHGCESELYDFFGDEFEMDEFGNLFIQIGDSDVMFTSHLDTATSANTLVNHTFEGDFIKTDGSSILGADDKAGVTIMLHMIENKVPGLYYFFIGEEVGCIGSRALSSKHKTDKIEYIKKVISFDRRGTDSVITFQAGYRCCSNEFGESLSKMLNDADSTFKYSNDPTGVYTDSAQFVSIYPECTNISVGYYSEHTFSEKQNIKHLEKLADACLKVDWNSLPVKRDPSTKESKYYGGNYTSSYSRYDDEDDYYWNRTRNNNYNNSYSLAKEHIYDSKYKYVSTVEYNKVSKTIVTIKLHQDRLDEEISVIKKLLDSIDVDYIKLNWDGKKVTVTTSERTVYITREEISQYLSEFSLENMSEYLDPDKNSLKITKV